MKWMKGSALFLLMLILGCSGPSKQDVLEYLASDSADRYKIHLFYESRTDLDMQLLEYMNSSDELLIIIQGIQLYDIDTPKNQEMAKKIGVDRYPAMVVTNNKEVVLVTQELEEVRDFFDQWVQ